ncbi:hypothetical protein C5167_006437 [Papaver somniferum]|uniref:Uncharacterized protein n=1 Tax=Papaver somniferum TaxID=3469 RepID=A0A4Y7JF35_PAPSO|nr:hypothetical protein C5167_006437 [Papaver somniferum]
MGQPVNNMGPSIPRGARLSSIKRLAQGYCSTTTETFGEQSVNGVGQSITYVVRLSSIRKLARNHRSPTAEFAGIPNNEDQPSHRDTTANIPIVGRLCWQVLCRLKKPLIIYLIFLIR